MSTGNSGIDNVIAFRNRDGSGTFTCVDCGNTVYAAVHRDEPRCGICTHLPGWRIDEKGRLVAPAKETANA